MKLTQTNIGVVGTGKMATALVQGFIKSKAIPPEGVFAYDIHSQSLETFCQSTGCHRCSSHSDLCQQVERVLFAVKPADLPDAIQSCGELLNGKLAISIAAGVPLPKLRALTTPTTRWIRVMPNTPTLVGCGASVFCADTAVTTEEKNWIHQLLSTVGISLELAEKYFDIVTALSGSGPAYVFTFIEAMADAGVMGGLTRSQANLLAAQTVLGAAKMVLETNRHPYSLREEVTSPGGTTIAGLLALAQSGFSAAVHSAIAAAAKRSKEITME